MFVVYFFVSIITFVAIVALIYKLRWAFLGLILGALVSALLLYFFELSPPVKLIIVPFLLFTGWGWGWEKFGKELDN